MPIITLPTAALCEQFGPVPEGYAVKPWDLSHDPSDAGSIAAVLMPNYYADDAGLRRLSKLSGLKLLQIPSAGYDHLTVPLAANAVVANGRGIHDAETAELAIRLVLASLRGIDTAVRDAQSHEWNSRFRPSLADRRVLLLGYGSIGSAIARRLAPFGVTITAVARTERDDADVIVHSFDALPDLLRSAEVVIVTLPLTESTRNFVDAEFLAAMPFGARLINIARGGVVDTDALVDALEAGRIFAALDVTEPEPLPATHPLWDAPNLILTPHIGGKTTATESRTLALFRRQVRALATGDALENVVELATA